MRRCLILATVLSAIAGSGRADLAADCAESAEPLLRVESCTRLLNATGLEPRTRARAHSNRGLAYERLGRLRRALADYDRAIELDPFSAPAHNNRGNVHAALGDLERALADHARAIELAPDYSHAHYNLAVDLEELGRVEEAIAEYTRTLEIDPGYDAALVGRASLRCRAGARDGAREDYLAALDRGAVEAEAFQTRLKEAGVYDGAIDGVFGPGSRAALDAWIAARCSG